MTRRDDDIVAAAGLGSQIDAGADADLYADPSTADRLRRVAVSALGHYDLTEPPAGPASLRLVNVSENATFRVDVGHGQPPRILRVHRLGYHSPAQIASELAWMDAVREQAGVRTPRALPAADGRRVLQVLDPDGGPPRTVVMFEFLPGREPDPDHLVDNAQHLGRLTARLHLQARSWRPPAGFDRFRWDLDAVFGAHPRWGRWEDGVGVGVQEHAVLARLQRVITRRLAAFGTGADRFGLVHADLRAANLLVSGVGGALSVNVIDFDDCGFSWYLYDLAAAVSFVEDRPDLPAVIDGWLTGYRSLAELSTEDAAEIDTLVMLRRVLLLAWLGTHRAVPGARDLTDGFAEGTCRLAEAYLSRHT